MKIKSILKTIGKMMVIEGLLLIAPLIVSFIHKEGTFLSFIIPSLSLIFVGGILAIFIKVEDSSIYARDGFLIVAVSWILLSIFGSTPFIISGEIPDFIDALFETVSGFTTTGATILGDIEVLSKGILFWRSLTHFIGGMGILVFVLAVMPSQDKNSANGIYVIRAESTGPSIGKLVSKIQSSARILYLIYIGVTVLETILLLFGGNSLYDSMVLSFSTAGTGGFGTLNTSIATYSNYTQILIGVFMLVYGVNFNMFYLLLVGKFKDFFKNEEFRWYIGIAVCSVIIVFFNILHIYETAGHALRDAFFQVSSIMTTTGFSTVDFNTWPMLSKFVLFCLMFIGSSAGCTAGGLKVSRVVIMFKSTIRDLKTLLHPRSVISIHMDGKVLDNQVVDGVKNYFYTYMGLFLLFVGLISINGYDFETTISSVAACFNNVGPGFGLVSASSNYGFFSGFSKVILSISMIFGRLEIYPMLLLFYPRTYRN